MFLYSSMKLQELLIHLKQKFLEFFQQRRTFCCSFFVWNLQNLKKKTCFHIIDCVLGMNFIPRESTRIVAKFGLKLFERLWIPIRFTWFSKIFMGQHQESRGHLTKELLLLAETWLIVFSRFEFLCCIWRSCSHMFEALGCLKHSSFDTSARNT